MLGAYSNTKSTPSIKPKAQTLSVPKTAAPASTARDNFQVVDSAGTYDAGAQSYTGGGTSSGGYNPDYGNGATAAIAAAQPPAQSDDDWLGQDSGFQATLAALLKASQGFNTDLDTQKSRYSTDYDQAVRSLGWTQDDPGTPQNEGMFSQDDTNTASGRSYQSQLNDFASRGLLQSTLFDDARTNLTRSLTDQLGGVNTSRQNFMDDLTKQKTQYADQYAIDQQQARQEALQRRASGLF